MFYQIVYAVFSNIFGKCRPIVINDYETHLQVKYELGALDVETFYLGLENLKKRYRRSGYAVRVLIVYPGTVQVIVGNTEEVSRTGADDFMIEICKGWK